MRKWLFASLMAAVGFGWMAESACGVSAVAVGGLITTNGDYVAHTFMNSGTLTVLGGGDVDVLVVGGGGGGGRCATGNQNAGAGGGGGVIYTTSFAVVTGNFSITSRAARPASCPA